MPKNKEFLLKPKAVEDLESIYKYSYENFGLAKAKEIRPKLKGYKVISHIIFFELSEDGIIILRILHKAMEHLNHMN